MDSGTSRDERLLMDAVPGLLVKGGAEGVDAFALADANGVRAGAVKIEDGRTGPDPVTVAALRLLGAVVPDELATVPVIGGSATELLWASSGRSASDRPLGFGVLLEIRLACHG